MIDSFEIRNSSFGLHQVRHSQFVIRHCPAPHDATGRFDFVLANPPFNVSGWFCNVGGCQRARQQELPKQALKQDVHTIHSGLVRRHSKRT